jgi:phenylacetic acid degradation protein
MTAYSLEGLIPVVDPSAFVHPQAALIGDVIVGPGCYVAPGASLRGDYGRIVIGRGCNVQDNCVLHTFPGRVTLLEDDVHIGHGSVLHGCTIRRGALIGIGAIVMDDALVEEEAIVGAACFVPARFTVPARTLVTGIPARVVRALKSEEIAWKAAGTREYQELAVRCRASLKECEPLRAPEANRPVRESGAVVPLHSIERPPR